MENIGNITFAMVLVFVVLWVNFKKYRLTGSKRMYGYGMKKRKRQ
ncbi:hypothetical protein Q0590_26065 [Rhodocytophaga aerolata]|uniref:Uncharacterized protein n=1 Tax=Rhodocytophaga aerolata TaxID=455078 RepID=A0ABT8RDI1_9BACT|nr:hypothetical protein [Rhodocytophaga aerolata]MDO1449771.1 hypothetical protein [Rhodocytophaga aerolata]